MQARIRTQSGTRSGRSPERVERRIQSLGGPPVLRRGGRGPEQIHPCGETKRTVADRQKSLQPVDPDANFTLAGVRGMYASVGKEFRCTISGHCRTRIFEFPRIDLRPNGDAPHYTIYDSPPLHACVTSNLVGYFEKRNAQQALHNQPLFATRGR